MDFEYDNDDDNGSSSVNNHNRKSGTSVGNNDGNASDDTTGRTVPFETDIGHQGQHSPTSARQQQQSTQLSLPKKKSSLLGASSNLVNSIVGAGIIGIPYAFRMSGLLPGVLLLVLVALLTGK